MIRKLTQREKAAQRKKQARKERNYVANMDVYQRGTQSAVDDYLASAAPPDPERVERIKADAQARRQRRNQRRLELQ